MNEKTTPTTEVPYNEKISRLFIFRFLWVYILIWPMIPMAIYVGIVNFLHFFYQLVLGKRNKGMWELHVRMFKWFVKWQTYLGLMTDKRPGFWF